MSVLEQHSQLVGGGSESRDHVAWASGGGILTQVVSPRVTWVGRGLKTGAGRDGLRAERPSLGTRSHT